jgi:hypothetical protein
MSQYTHQLTMLDPAILTSPFETYTRWHVITGAACCGKTTLIEMLSAKGIQVIPASARIVTRRTAGFILERLSGADSNYSRGLAQHN